MVNLASRKRSLGQTDSRRFMDYICRNLETVDVGRIDK